MSDNIIKNKNREIKAGIKHVAYQPEYERLNIEPVVNKVDQHDFMARKANYKRQLPQQQQEVQRKLPQSGQNEDIIWSQGLSSADRVSVLQQKIRNEIMEKEDKEAFDSIDDKSSFELVDDYNRNFRYDDIPNAPASLIEDDIGLEEQEDQEEQEEQEEEHQEEENAAFKLSDLRSGDNILLYNEEIICAGSIEEIKEVLSKILLNSNNYLVEDFVVLKRLNIRAGIFIE
jgi:hypothetical protein